MCYLPYITDIDECVEGTARCDAEATCTNIIGGYNCTCNSGYEGDGYDGNCSSEYRLGYEILQRQISLLRSSSMTFNRQ